MYFKEILLAIMLILTTVGFGAETIKNNRIKVNEATLKIIGDETPMMIRIPPPASYTNKSGQILNGAKIKVTYNGFSAQAKAAFQEAVDIWASLIQSPVEIRIDAYWRTLESALGSCGPTNYYRGYDGMPFSETFYPIALAEKLAGENLNDSSEFEMTANFNKSADWYFGKDGNTPADKYDLLSVVLHEICHGLGFIGSFSVDNGLGSWGWGTGSTFAFDHFIIDQKNNHLIDEDLYPNDSKALKDALTSRLLYFDGPLLKAEYGKTAMLYAPAEWNPGSSIYHVANSYSSGSDALMTFSINKGKSIHDPGKIAVNILNEIGWRHVRYLHEPVINTEEIRDVTISTRIVPDFSTGILNPTLYYSKDSSAYVEVNLTRSLTDTTLYTAVIPITESVDVSYYLSSKDKYGRTFSIPVNAPDINYHFFLGADTISPDIKHYPINFLLPGQDSVQFTTTVNDGFGIDSVWLEYSVNGVDKGRVVIPKKKDSQYQILLDISGYNVQVGDSINYRIGALDKSKTGNIGYSPREGTIRMIVEAVPEFVESLDNSFEVPKNDFILQGFEILQPDGFYNNSLNTLHPYEFAGEESSLDYIAQLRYPVRVKEQNHYMSYDEIVLVEPGEPGTQYGDEEFWDYVIVEVSKDKGNTWSPLEPGYDSGYREEWKSAYNQSMSGQFSQAVGTPSMFKNHFIDLLGSGRIKVGDEILIRFRLYSDPFANGWGWAIDNLKIQTDNVGSSTLRAVNDVKVFPNPVKNGLLNIVSNSTDQETIELYNLQGALVYQKQLDGLQQIQLPRQIKGVYFLILKSNESNERIKLYIE